uniref:Photosystem I reaction center subunit Nic n=1 Tax=Rhizophora mucronata TaxID=61149 RepID=A0A2P2KSE4_RHIMU
MQRSLMSTSKRAKPTRFVFSEKEPNFRISIKDKRGSGVELVQSCGIFYFMIYDLEERDILLQELNDKKRLATSGANFARAYTVQFGTCGFPENFTGCQDLAKQKVQIHLRDVLSVRIVDS